MTDLRKLLGAANVAVAAHQAYPDGKSSLERARREMALQTAAVNALPALLDVVEAAQRLQEWEDRASWLSANRPAFGSEPIYTTWWRASTKHDAARPAIAEALTAALAQWEKQ